METRNFSVGLMRGLANTTAKVGQKPVDLLNLQKNRDVPGIILSVLKKELNVYFRRDIINCDKEPRIPFPDWQIYKHKKNGLFRWDSTKIKLLLLKKQFGSVINGDKLYYDLKKLPLVNANILDYLLEHPSEIPRNWKKNEKGNTHAIIFWGTIYRSTDNKKHVRYLFFNGYYWVEDILCLEKWPGHNPAAVVC